MRSSTTRKFLFLQGHPSGFHKALARELEKRGIEVLHVNFCAGDFIYGFGRKALNYRGRFAHWPIYLKKLISDAQITDIIYYADQRPYHREAARVAQSCDIRAFAYEFGYLRPDWITLERDGMGAYSHFPDDRAQILKLAAQYRDPDLTPKYRHSKSIELFHEVFYHLASYFLHFTYPYYHADRYYNPLLEYLTGIPTLFTENRDNAQATMLIENLLAHEKGFFLIPLQLQNDYQLRCNANFEHQGDVINLIIKSFKHHAAPNEELLFKCHPLDNGWEGWPKIIQRAAEKHGISDRIHYIKGGDLDLLLRKTRGTVLINSTVGLQALEAGCPLKVLGIALYDIEGLTDAQPLDQFWKAPTPPDAKLMRALTRALTGTIQIKGSFFDKAGRHAAVRECVLRLLSADQGQSGAYVDPPPRLAKLQQ